MILFGCSTQAFQGLNVAHWIWFSALSLALGNIKLDFGCVEVESKNMTSGSRDLTIDVFNSDIIYQRSPLMSGGGIFNVCKAAGERMLTM